MLKQSLLGELQHEAENTRKLFDAIPDDVLEFKANEFNWTIAGYASHIAEIYSWWAPTLNENVLDLANYSYDKGDISTMAGIKSKLEENIASAVKALEEVPEEKFMENWSMVNGDQEIMPPMPRIQVARAFLMNHLYHHRGEVVAFLRANGKPVPGMYGPSYEESMAMSQSA